jgi:hypothetical protein
MEKTNLDIERLTEVPVRQFTRFLRFIAEHDLWDELEQQLKDRGCDKLLMSFEPVKAIGTMAETRSRELSGKQSEDSSDVLLCGCNGSLGPQPGPVTPLASRRRC